MIAKYPERRKIWRPTALLLTTVLTCPLFVSCGGNKQSSVPPPVDDTRGGSQVAPGNTPQAKKGLSNAQKVGITLVGAAALYYLYKQHQKKQNEGEQGKYYLSKNGRVYYRDEQKRAHWVTPPANGVQVPEEEAKEYRDFKGYNGSSTGKDLTGLSQEPVPAGVQ